MDIAAIIISVISICFNVFILLENLDIIKFKSKDKYSKYRNEDGLFTTKKSRDVWKLNLNEARVNNNE